jgi:hypothetical protein
MDPNRARAWASKVQESKGSSGDEARSIASTVAIAKAAYARRAARGNAPRPMDVLDDVVRETEGGREPTAKERAAYLAAIKGL